MYGLCVLSNYVFFLVVVPMLAHCECFRTYFLPRVAHLLHLSKVPIDQHLLAVGLVTLFVYFLLNLTLDVIQTIQTLSSVCRQRRISTHERTTATSTSTSITTKRTTTTQSISGGSHPSSSLGGSPQTTISSAVSPTCNISIGVNRAHQQLVHYYPAFVASTFLVWANTNKFDTFSIAFVMIQVIFLLLLPFSYACPHPLISHINRIAYQCAMAWTLAYAIYPRDVGYVLDRSANEIHTFFSPAPTDIYYTPIL